MSLIKKSTLVRLYNDAQKTLLGDEGEKIYSKNSLAEFSESFSPINKYDIFLSHSYDDARIIRQIYNMLKEKGFSVYVDWIRDKLLTRNDVTVGTAKILRFRMNCCLSLLYITSLSATKSVWMPWELGYMDAKTSRVAIAPILEESEDFRGREYLGLYPYLDLTKLNFYVHQSPSDWLTFSDWFKGGKFK